MTKQKIVIKVEMAGESGRSKAMALVAAMGGVDSVALAGDGKDQVVVVGDVDSIKLTAALRKKFRHAQLVEVGEPKKEEKKKEPEVPPPPYPHWYYPPPADVVYQYPAGGYGYQYERPGTCSIM